MTPLPSGARTAPAAARNREPILKVLERWLPASGLVLEVAAGTGEHAAFFAGAFPGLQWRPTDPDPEGRQSIAAWAARAGLPNLLEPLALDASRPETWPLRRADAVVCINMIHIAPWSACEGLMAGAAALLEPGGVLVLYGPFREGGRHTAESNAAFDADLKRRNPEWGVRDLDAVSALAGERGLVLKARVPMPANNLTVVFRRD